VRAPLQPHAESTEGAAGIGARRFVILTTARTGSNLLCGMLNLVSGITCHREIFNPRRPYLRFEPPPELRSAEARDRDPIAFLRVVEQLTPVHFPETTVAGFKLFLTHNETILKHVIGDEGYQIVLLNRANKLAQYSSRLIAKSSSQWRLQPGQAPRGLRVEFDKEGFLRFIRRSTRSYAAASKLLEVEAKDSFELEYANLRNEDVFRQLLAFLDVEPGDGEIDRVMRSARVGKENSSTIADRFTNPGEVISAMIDLGFEEWLTEAVEGPSVLPVAPPDRRRGTRIDVGPPGSRREGTPDFIGIGAQKCATTFVFRALTSHPDVRFPATPDRLVVPSLRVDGREVVTWPKEIQFLQGPNAHLTWSEYLSLFSDKEPGKAYGEISPSYLTTPRERILELRERVPNVKLFVILRDPIERDWSAVRMIAGRRSELDDPEWLVRIAGWKQVAAMSAYAHHLATWLSVFPREQLLVLPYELISRDQPKFFVALCNHLGVAGEPLLDLELEPIYQGPALTLPDEIRDILVDRHAGAVAALRDVCGVDFSVYWSPLLS
jgi:LPS sulfotransferase NodH